MTSQQLNRDSIGISASSVNGDSKKNYGWLSAELHMGMTDKFLSLMGDDYD